MADVKHLEASELGTREYWDKHYENDITNGIEDSDLTALESWFDDCDAPRRVLEYLTDESFPLSPESSDSSALHILDLGCGNGSALFELRLEGGYEGHMVGVDYSQASVDLARALWNKHGNGEDIRFEKYDFLKDEQREWWPQDGFDLVLDKGTFDAISLSGEMVEMGGQSVRVVEGYPSKVATMVKQGGYLMITSCNWTEDEVVKWFTTGGMDRIFRVFGRVEYPTFEFGGQRGQGVASVCFQKI